MEMTFAPGWTQTIDTSSEVAERVDLTTYISDTYKAVNGIRPRWYDFQGAEIKYLREWAKHLEEEVVEEVSLERAREARPSTGDGRPSHGSCRGDEAGISYL